MTHIFSFRKYGFYYQDHLKFADVSIFLEKIKDFGESRTYTQSNSMRVLLESFYQMVKRILLMNV